MFFRPNLKVMVTPTAGHDVFGKEQMGEAYVAEIAIVRLVGGAEPTSVRTDSSASRGFAQEMVADSRLLFTACSPVKTGDKVEVEGLALRVKSVFPRVGLNGAVDHKQVDLGIW